MVEYSSVRYSSVNYPMKSNLTIRPTRLVSLGALTQQIYLRLNLSAPIRAQDCPATTHALLSLLMLKSCFLLRQASYPYRLTCRPVALVKARRSREVLPEPPERQVSARLVCNPSSNVEPPGHLFAAQTRDFHSSPSTTLYLSSPKPSTFFITLNQPHKDLHHSSNVQNAPQLASRRCNRRFQVSGPNCARSKPTQRRRP